ncbi:hypothetical protein GCM10022221_29280 [Actinocorallia aurea]
MIIKWRRGGRAAAALCTGSALLFGQGGGVSAAAPARWQDLRLPALAQGIEVTAVHAFGPKNVWVFTGRGVFDTAKPTKPKAYHWDGAKWRRFTLPRLGVVTEAAGSPKDFWVVVNSGQNASAWDGLLRRKGGRWAVAKRLPRGYAEYPSTGLTAVARDDVRVFSRDGQRSTTEWRYNGHAWTKKKYRYLSSFAILPNGTMWAANTTGGEDESFLFRNDGGGWKKQPLPSSLGCSPTDGDAEYCEQRIWYVEATSEKNLYVGYADRILRWDGADWSLFARAFFGGLSLDRSGMFWSVLVNYQGKRYTDVLEVSPAGVVTAHPYRGTAEAVDLRGLSVAPSGQVFVFGKAKAPAGSATKRRYHLWRVPR